MLTGKAKIDFYEYLLNGIDFSNSEKEMIRFQKSIRIKLFNSYEDIVQHALIIEWLDEQEIFIKINPYIGGGAVAFYPTIVYRNEQFIDCFDDLEDEQGSLLYFGKRSEAVEIAIKSAVEIYNSKNF